MVRDVVAVPPDAELMAVVQRFVAEDISGVVVVDEQQRVVGILTERDCIAAAVRSGYFDERRGGVAEFMSRDVETVGSDDRLMDVAERFVSSPYRRFPVVDGGKLVGVLSRRDVLRALRSDSWFAGGR
jgi:CBS domain-containing protein